MIMHSHVIMSVLAILTGNDDIIFIRSKSYLRGNGLQDTYNIIESRFSDT